jgi:hypothetical protein
MDPAIPKVASAQDYLRDLDCAVHQLSTGVVSERYPGKLWLGLSYFTRRVS